MQLDHIRPTWTKDSKFNNLLPPVSPSPCLRIVDAPAVFWSVQNGTCRGQKNLGRRSNSIVRLFFHSCFTCAHTMPNAKLTIQIVHLFLVFLNAKCGICFDMTAVSRRTCVLRSQILRKLLYSVWLLWSKHLFNQLIPWFSWIFVFIFNNKPWMIVPKKTLFVYSCFNHHYGHAASSTSKNKSPQVLSSHECAAVRPAVPWDWAVFLHVNGEPFAVVSPHLAATIFVFLLGVLELCMYVQIFAVFTSTKCHQPLRWKFWSTMYLRPWPKTFDIQQSVQL